MTNHNCWICKGVDRFIFKVLPWAIGALAIFSAGFYTRHRMAKDVIVTITGLHEDNEQFSARLRLRTDQVTSDRDEAFMFDDTKGAWADVKVNHVKIHMERDIDN